MDSERAFFEDLAKTYDYWLRFACTALSDPTSETPGIENPEPFRVIAKQIQTSQLQNELRIALSETLSGLLHSTLVTLDNGSSLADSVSLSLTDQNGRELGPGLHEGFSQYLVETGRL